MGGAVTLSGIWKIVVQLLLPFVVGHLLRPLLGGWAVRHKYLMTYTDRITVLLSVYSAFSAGRDRWHLVTGAADDDRDIAAGVRPAAGSGATEHAAGCAIGRIARA